MEQGTERSVDYAYRIKEDGTAAITDCLNPGRDMIVPAVIENRPVTEIGETAFYAAGLKTIALPQGVTEIGDYAFAQCGDLKSVVLPRGLVSIGAHAFEDCGELKRLTLPEGLTAIGESAFSGCFSLEPFRLPDSPRYVGENAFFLCPFDTLALPPGLSSLPDGAFGGLQKLNEIVIPEGVTRIGNRAFFGCISARSAVIPDSAADIGENPFARCEALRSLRVSPRHPVLFEENGVLLSRQDRRLITYPLRRVERYPGCPAETYSVPEGTRIIGAEAFLGGSVSGVTLPDGVEEIRRRAFSECALLKRVILPASVKSIGRAAFAGCPMLSCQVPPGSRAEQYCRENNIPFTN